MPKLPRPVLIVMFGVITFFALTILPEDIWLGIGLIGLTITLPLSYYAYVYYWGQTLAMRGQLRDAIQHYSRLLYIPTVSKAMVYARRAGLRNAAGDIDGAIEDYTAAMQHTSQEDPALYGVRSALYLVKREFQKALQDTDRLLELQPQAEVGYANRATAKMYLGDVQGAIADCDMGLNLDNSASGAALLYNNRGTAYRMNDDYTAAMSDYNLALSTSLNPQQKQMVHPTIITNQGIVYYLRGEYDQARAYFQQATGLNDNFLKAQATLALARFKMEQEENARTIWRDLIQRNNKYRNPSWIQRELNLPSAMMTDVTDLIETL